MLKGIPPIISPELMKALMEMGHGDEIVLADGNFPAASHSIPSNQLINGHGHGVPELLTAILKFFPLDTYVQFPIMLMNTVKGDNSPAIWKEYEDIVNKLSEFPVRIEKLEREDFYKRSKRAYAIVATSERAPYGNMILKKGVL
ncbi:RbsD/FucU family protein [Cytobacillus firmus]|uniref:RbsD/FucU family protein n=1 Tax=Cytobacillus firmus TaxID=1399 RepID=UPI001C8EF91E|nr:RbsD/FucU domain-containing protein [Cytobacillus firmus]MBX9975859.1 fucose isomerase [Cytobacillus firmus]